MGSVAKVGWEGDANFRRKNFFVFKETIDPCHQAENYSQITEFDIWKKSSFNLPIYILWG